MTIRTGTEGALIYYTRDGTTPTTSSSRYSTALSFNTFGTGSHTIKAIAVKEGHSNSTIAEARFTISYSDVVMNPSFNPANGNVLTTDSLTISSSTVGALIYYTTDGTTPTASSNRYRTALSFNTLGTGSRTIRAIAVKAEHRDSQIASESFTVAQPIVLSPSFSPANGSVLTTDSLTISTGTAGAQIYYTTDGTRPTTSSSRYTSPVSFGTIGTGSRDIKAIAVKTGHSDSQITSESFTVAQPIVLSPSFSPANGNVLTTDSLTISTGSAGALIYYTTDGSEPTSSSSSYTSPVSFATIGTGSRTIKAIAVRTGYANSAIAETSFTVSYSNTVLSPTFSPANGNVLSTDSLVISSATSGASIHYTTDGSEPTSSSSRYISPVSFATIGTGSRTIRAIAVKEGYNNSELSSTTFSVSLATVATPTFSPANGSVLSTDSLAISSATSGASIHYTTDGSEPTSSSSRYTSPVSFATIGTGSRTIKAIAVRTGYANSAIAETSFTVSYPNTVLSPAFSPANGNVVHTDSLVISSATSGASIHYTTDGSEPTSSSSRYTSPVSFGALGTGSRTIKAIALKAGYNDSEITSTSFSVSLASVATPTLSPANGNVLSTDSLAISSSTPGASIHYTTDGSEPTSLSSRYTSPVSFATIGTGSRTIKAIAVRTGYVDSAIAETSFTVSYPNTVLSPTFSPANGNVVHTASLVISSATSGASIHYTTDGSEPTSSSSRYISPVSFGALGTGSRTIKTIALKAGYNDSEIASTSFTVSLATVATPILSPASGNVVHTGSLAISSSTPGASIYYTTDGSEPTSSSSRYTSSVSFATIGTGSRTIKAIALKAGYSNSELVSTAFTVERDVDVDDDGLIEIADLDMLNNVRYNLLGTNYKTGSGDSGSSAGAPASRPANCAGRSTSTNLCGYELTQNLDFATAAHYASGSVNNAWRPNNVDPDNATNAGFTGLGPESGTSSGFVAIFEGNSHTINNFYSRNPTSSGRNIGLFSLVHSGGIVRNIGVTNINVYGGNGADYAGGLVGYTRGTILASYATGKIDGGDTNYERSFGRYDRVGGLAGLNFTGGKIIASYAAVDVDGGETQYDHLGGLVGQNTSIITASYATGDVDGKSGNYDRIGGLTGENNGTIQASYATGNPDGGDGILDYVGGLVGRNYGTIRASYATGDSDGGAGGSDYVGTLIGFYAGTVTESYAFGSTSNGEIPTYLFQPSGVSTAAGLRADNAGASWNSTSYTAGAWNFGTSSQNPALVYADYDGSGSTYACSDYPATIPGTSTTLTCGSSLLGGQR